MKKRIFISYTSKDPAVSEERLKIVETKLKPFASVFIDKLHNKKGGQCRVNLELWRCDALIQLVSAGHQSEWAKRELITARKRRKPVVKISIDDLLKKDDEEVFFLLDEIEKKRWSVWSILILSVLVCVGISFLGIWLSYLYVSNQPGVSDVMNARGVFGDSWGGVNTIISAFAFAGVIVTLFLQNRDLNLQRKEMARQREEFEKENETLKYQRFENLFYNMLNLQQELTRDLVIEHTEMGKDPVVKHGRDVFPYFYEEMKIRYAYNGGCEVTTFKRVLGMDDGLKNKLVAVRQLWFLDHYMRHLYRIFRYINDAEEISDTKKREYTAIVRATLSPYELVFLYYIGFSHPRFKKLIEKYTLLNNLRPFLLASPDEGQKVARKFQEGYRYETDKDIDETSEYRKTAFVQKESMDEGDLLTR